MAKSTRAARTLDSCGAWFRIRGPLQGVLQVGAYGFEVQGSASKGSPSCAPICGRPFVLDVKPKLWVI